MAVNGFSGTNTVNPGCRIQKLAFRAKQFEQYPLVLSLCERERQIADEHLHIITMKTRRNTVSLTA